MPPSLSPQKINEMAWYYEDKKSLQFMVECRDKMTGVHHKTLSVRVPLAMLRKSLKRIGKAGRRKRTAAEGRAGLTPKK